MDEPNVHVQAAETDQLAPTSDPLDRLVPCRFYLPVIPQADSESGLKQIVQIFCQRYLVGPTFSRDLRA